MALILKEYPSTCWFYNRLANRTPPRSSRINIRNAYTFTSVCNKNISRFYWNVLWFICNSRSGHIPSHILVPGSQSAPFAPLTPLGWHLCMRPPFPLGLSQPLPLGSERLICVLMWTCLRASPGCWFPHYNSLRDLRIVVRSCSPLRKNVGQ